MKQIFIQLYNGLVYEIVVINEKIYHRQSDGLLVEMDVNAHKNTDSYPVPMEYWEWIDKGEFWKNFETAVFPHIPQPNRYPDHYNI